jgi:hypothetical protein
VRRFSPLARLLLAAVLLVIAAAATGISTAAMTGDEQEAPSTFTAGTLDLAVDAPGATLLDATDMRPGQTRTAIVGLRDAGTVAARLTVAIGDRADVPAAAALSAVLVLRLEDCGADPACAAPVVIYDGSLGDFATATVGDVAAGAVRHVRVSLVWDASKADPARQGARTDATLVWQAVAGSAQ